VLTTASTIIYKKHNAMAPKLCEDPSSLGNGIVVDSVKMSCTKVTNKIEINKDVTITPSATKPLASLPSSLNTIATYISKIFGLVLVSYFLLYQHENLNFFLLVGRVVWLLCLLLCCYQEDITATVFGATNVVSGSRKPCSIEYNTQVKLVVGLISYCMAAYLLVQSSPTSKDMSSLNTISLNTTLPLSSYSSIELAINNDPTPKSYLFYIFGLLASYYSFEKVFTEWFCRMPTSALAKVQQGSGSSFGDIERTLGVPTCLILMFMMKNFTIHDAGYHSLLTTLYGWFTFKILHIAFALNHNRKLKSYNLPAMLASTPLGTKRIAEDAMLTSNAKDETAISTKHVWRMYGNEYDVTDYVHKHPGGVETIMLAADREDSTAIFQSYHPFNITKARTVLEKYRISSNSGDDKPVPTANVPHANDLFYNVLVERVRDVLKNKYDIDPVKDRAAPFDRILFYSVIVTGVIVSLVAHCKVRISTSKALMFC
jgi:cytochrome b involved in lipid metabolism